MKDGVLHLAGKITISRCDRGNQPSVMRIDVQDEGSRAHFLIGEMSMTDFALAITGHGCMPINMEIRGLNVLGMLAENKTELVIFAGRRFSSDMKADVAGAEEAIARFEVDGWVGQWQDLFNSHNLVAGTQATYRVSFRRWVPREAEVSRET